MLRRIYTILFGLDLKEELQIFNQMPPNESNLKVFEAAIRILDKAEKTSSEEAAPLVDSLTPIRVKLLKLCEEHLQEVIPDIEEVSREELPHKRMYTVAYTLNRINRVLETCFQTDTQNTQGKQKILRIFEEAIKGLQKETSSWSQVRDAFSRFSNWYHGNGFLPTSQIEIKVAKQYRRLKQRILLTSCAEKVELFRKKREILASISERSLAFSRLTPEKATSLLDFIDRSFTFAIETIVGNSVPEVEMQRFLRRGEIETVLDFAVEKEIDALLEESIFQTLDSDILEVNRQLETLQLLSEVESQVDSLIRELMPSDSSLVITKELLKEFASDKKRELDQLEDRCSLEEVSGYVRNLDFAPIRNKVLLISLQEKKLEEIRRQLSHIEGKLAFIGQHHSRHGTFIQLSEELVFFQGRLRELESGLRSYDTSLTEPSSLLEQDILAYAGRIEEIMDLMKIPKKVYTLTAETMRIAAYRLDPSILLEADKAVQGALIRRAFIQLKPEDISSEEELYALIDKGILVNGKAIAGWYELIFSIGDIVALSVEEGMGFPEIRIEENAFRFHITERLIEQDHVVSSIALEVFSLKRETTPAPLRAIIDLKLTKTLESVPLLPLPLVGNKRSSQEFLEDDKTGGSRLAHIVLDGFTADSKLEGACPSNTSGWLLEHLIALVPGHPFISALQRFQESAREMEGIQLSPSLEKLVDFVKKCEAAIKALEPGERFLLPGGWRSPSGAHFILYEFLKEEGGTYQFNVYNSGAGSELFHDILYKSGKEKIRPVMTFRGIEKEVLFAPGKVFLQPLLEMRIENKISSKVAAETIYVKIILSKLSSYRRPALHTEFSTAQRAGTCAYSGLIAFLRTSPYLSIEQFKALQIRIKARELLHAFSSINDLRKPGKEAESLRYLLYAGSSWFLNRLIKAYRKGNYLEIPKEELLQNIKIAWEMRKSILKSRALADLMTKATPSSIFSKAITKGENPLALSYKVETLEAAPLIPSMLPPRPLHISLEEMQGALLALPTVWQEWKGINYEVGLAYMISYIEALPGPEEVSNSDLIFTEEDLRNNFSFMNTLVNSFPVYTITFEEKMALFKLYALQHAMAVSIDRRIKEGFPIADLRYAHLDEYKCHAQVDDRPFYEERLAFMPIEAEGMQACSELITYFSTFNEKCQREGQDHFAIVSHRHNMNAEMTYYTRLLQENPELEKEYDKYPTLSLQRSIEVTDTSYDYIRNSTVIFKKHGLSHLDLLRKAALIFANKADGCVLNEWVGNFHSSEIRRSMTDRGNIAGKSYNALEYHSGVDSGGARCFGSTLENANYKLPIKEAKLLEKEVKSDSLSVFRRERMTLKELIRAGLSDEISCHLVIDQMKENIERFSWALVRSQFNLIFFDPKTLMKMPILLQDKALVRAIEEFVHKGIQVFLLRRMGSPDYQGLLGILDFALKVQRLRKKNGTPSFSFLEEIKSLLPFLINNLEKEGGGIDPFLQRLLLLTKHSSEKNAIESLVQRQLASQDEYVIDPLKGKMYFVQQLLLLSFLYAEESPQDSTFVSTWLRCNWLDHETNNGMYSRPPIRTELFQDCYDALENIKERVERMSSIERQSFVAEVLEKTALTTDPIESVIYTSPLVFEVLVQGGAVYKIDVIRAQITKETPGGFLSVYQKKAMPYWARGEKFLEFFKVSDTVFFTTLRGVEFDHPTGHYIVKGDPESKDVLEHLYTEIAGYGEGMLVTICDFLPQALITSFVHWLLPNEDLLICDTRNKPMYYVEKGGLIHPIASPGKEVRFLQGECSLSAIEHFDCILTVWDSEVLEEVSYPRLFIQGSPLIFTRIEGKLLLSSDKRFQLILEPPRGIASSFKNFLYLQNTHGGRDHILVPICEKVKEPTPTTSMQLEFNKKESAEAIPCLLFALDKGTLVGEDNAANLYLLWLALSQKEYAKCLNLGDKLLLKGEPLSKIENFIVNKIFKEEDSHPNTSAMILHVRYAMQKLEGCEGVLRNYLSCLDKVDACLKLPEHQLLAFVRQFPDDPLCLGWTRYLREGVWPLEELSITYRQSHSLTLSKEEESLVRKWTEGEYPAYYRQDVVQKEMKEGPSTERWMTRLSKDLWPGFYRYAYGRIVEGPLEEVEKMHLSLSCILHNPEADLSCTQVVLLKFLYKISLDRIEGKETVYSLKAEDSLTAVGSLLGQVKEAEEITKTKEVREIAPWATSHYMPKVLLRPREFISFFVSEAIEALCSLPSCSLLFNAKSRGGFIEPLPSIDSLSLLPEEEPYRVHIEKAVMDFCEQVALGQKLLREELVYQDKGEAHLLDGMLLEKKGILQENHDLLEKKILLLANRTGFIHEEVELITGRRPALDREMLYYLYTKRSYAAFKIENPNLSEEDFIELMQMLFDSLMMQTTLQHIERILLEPDLSKKAELLARERAYDPKAHPEYLSFEYFLDMRLFPFQVNLLDELKEKKLGLDEYVAKVGQLMMGGGKTKVLSVLLLFASLRPGFLAMLAVPSALYNVTYSDLSRAFKKSFACMVNPLTFSREELGEERCLAIEGELKDAMEWGQVILIRSESLHLLRLQYMFEYEMAAEGSRPLSEKGEILGRIWRIIYNQGDLLLDEIHLLLKQGIDVNIPIGEEESVFPPYVDLEGEILSLVAKHPRVQGLLQSNDQEVLSENEYMHIILPDLITEYLSSFPPSGLSLEEANTYLLSKEGYLAIEEKLLAFYESEDGKKKLEANKLALARYVFTELLPHALKKSYGRNFGPLPPEMAFERSMEAGKIVPYQAVGIPSTTLFATWEEEVLYGFMTAECKGITGETFAFVYESWKIESGGVEEMTGLNDKVKHMTGFSLFDLSDRKKYKEAFEKLNLDSSKKRMIMGEFLKLTVKYHSERLCGSPQDFLYHSRGLSGTPYNQFGYPGGLNKILVQDPGVEGKIAATLLCKMDKAERTVIHKVEEVKAGPLLESLVKKHPSKDRIRGLQDPGGVFKGQDNTEVAKAFNAVIKSEDLPLQGTLAFWRKSGMAAANQIGFFFVEEEIPISLKGSSLIDLQERDIHPKSMFTYCDEQRTTGFDPPQEEGSINLMTLVLNQDIVSAFQSILRLRKFITGDQEVEFVIPATSYDKMPQDLRGILVHMVKNLAIIQAKQFYEAMRQKIDATYRNAISNFLLSGPGSIEKVNQYKALRSLYADKIADDPFAAHGRKPKSVDSLIALWEHIQYKYEIYIKSGVDLGSAIEAPEKMLQSLLTEEEKKLLPKTVLASSFKQGLEIFEERAVQKQEQVQQEKKAEVEVHEELLTELALYKKEYAVIEETSFPIEAFLVAGQIRPPAFSLLLSETMQQCPLYTRPYYDLFDEMILVTENFAPNLPSGEGKEQGIMPIFCKAHRPAKQVLVERLPNGSYHFLLLSLQEADTVKAYLKKLEEKPEHLWLIDTYGGLLDMQDPSILQEPTIQRALLQTAAFNGDVAYLHRHKDAALAWLEEDLSKIELKRRLIIMKAQQDPMNKTLAASSTLLYPDM